VLLHALSLLFDLPFLAACGSLLCITRVIESCGGGRRFGAWRCQKQAPFPLARPRSKFGFTWEPTFYAGIVEIGQIVSVCLDQSVTGSEEHVVAGGIGREKVGVDSFAPAGNKRGASFRTLAATYAGWLPLINIFDPFVGIARYQRVLGVEKESPGVSHVPRLFQKDGAERPSQHTPA
jgi:hypothetical protein